VRIRRVLVARRVRCASYTRPTARPAPSRWAARSAANNVLFILVFSVVFFLKIKGFVVFVLFL
jgi:hypothetical protein